MTIGYKLRFKKNVVRAKGCGFNYYLLILSPRQKLGVEFRHSTQNASKNSTEIGNRVS